MVLRRGFKTPSHLILKSMNTGPGTLNVKPAARVLISDEWTITHG